tara:strand:- start:805 stop:1269 length:465 start_codon:yes stop_codon:yes gene_type:complete
MISFNKFEEKYAIPLVVIAASLLTFTGCTALNSVASTITENKEGISELVKNLGSVSESINGIVGDVQGKTGEALRKVQEWIHTADLTFVNIADEIGELDADQDGKIGLMELVTGAGGLVAAAMARNGVSAKSKAEKFAALETSLAEVKTQNGMS